MNKQSGKRNQTVIIREFGDYTLPGSYILDLAQQTVTDCIGCWSCWIRTPGRCVHHDLDDFYRAFLSADKALFFLRVSMGFVSGNVKTLFDRMIPQGLPYISYHTGESMHESRYTHYPDVEIYYSGHFDSAEEQQLYEEYLARVFYQLQQKHAVIQPISAYQGEGEKA